MSVVDLKEKLNNRLFKIYLLLILGIVLLSVSAFFLLGFLKKKLETGKVESAIEKSAPTIPVEILENKFGFLGGNHQDGDIIKKMGASWARPHPGPFLWDSMQGQSSKIIFTETDEAIKELQKESLGALITLWPFNDSDQEKRADYQKCQVSKNDEFLPKGMLKEPGNYLPHYRCNPYDWEAYGKWVKATVERYDGDGIDDMPGLKYPIKHWEVMNEPDLGLPPDAPKGEKEGLDFYKEGSEEYATLLKKTSKFIKEADSEAKVLIAGAAGGDEHFLDFYKRVFADKEAIETFDIANIHCISNDREPSPSFNVKAYKELLESYGIKKPIWVTEAEAVMSSDTEKNIASTKESVKNALAFGAQRIFFTRPTFEGDMNKEGGPKDDPKEMKDPKKKEAKDKLMEEAARTYREIIESLGN